MSARDKIFAAIRQAPGSEIAPPQDIARAAAALVGGPEKVQPGFAGVGLVDRFVAKATSERVTATVEPLPDCDAVPDAVKRYLKAHDLAPSIGVQPCASLTTLDWGQIECAETVVADGGVAVTWAEYGVAETGSVVFRSGPDAPILLNFLPLHHIVALPRTRILGYSEDLWPLIGGADVAQTRVLTLITGTSGTSDIEAINIRGAHGPKFLHILLIDGLFEDT